ncbi:hypothetical protein GOBAR_DD24559 [Gossypium barbadense]|nr:hypothetical protein GOBAR_DD24559 [Gossypium barbadense]
MVALYCSPERLNIEPILLFVELADAKPVEDVTLLSQQYRDENLCTEVLKASVDRRSSMHDFNIDLNVGFEDFSDSDIDDVLDGIGDEGADDENDYAPLVGNSSRGIIIRNDLEAYMSFIDPDAAYASKFL